MAQTDPQPATAGTSAEASQPANYDHLPDLPADLSMDAADDASRPTFEQLNATLISRGYLRIPLNVAGMREESLGALADALHAMIAQREEDIEVRTALTAKNRTLTASLERSKRFQKEEAERSADFERKAEASKARLAQLTTELETERKAHAATKEASGRMRRDLQAIKASALQYKAANDRSVARVRARIGEVTSSAIRSAVPDFQIVASAFNDLPSTSSSKASSSGLYAQQVQELEQKHAHLVEYNRALKRFATEAINAARRADQELLDMVEAEEDDAKKRDLASGSKPSSGSSGARSVSSSSLNNVATSKRSASSDAWLEGHRPLFQRDLFPANDTLRSTPSGALVSGSSSKTPHPALRALEVTTTAISTHVQSLLDLRTERTVHYAALNQRISAQVRDQVWAAKLEQEIQNDLQNDARLSLNKINGPAHVGSLASAAIAASGGASNGGTSQRVDWQKEKAELEKKLAQLVKQVAIAEENAARKAKEVKALAEAEKRARSMLDQALSSAVKIEETVGTAEALQQAEELKAKLGAAEQERERYAKRCEMLEAEARELRNEHGHILLEKHHLPQSVKMTSLKRLDDVEVAEIHARDQKRRSDLGSLSVVAEDAEMPSLTSTIETAETASDDMDDEGANSRRSIRKARKSKESVDAGATSFGESFGNNPELDAIFGVGKAKAKAGRAESAPRRSSRLSGGSAEAASEAVEEQAPVEQVDSRKRKADTQPQENADLSSTSKRRTSRRTSGGSDTQTEAAAKDLASPRASKRPRPDLPPSEPSVGPTTSAKPTQTVSASDAQSKRRLSTREKQELEQHQKQQRAASTAAPSTKTPAPGARRIVSGSSSSVTRPTAASLRRSEAIQATKRPLSNATNKREDLSTAPSSTKTPHRGSASSATVRARS